MITTTSQNTITKPPANDGRPFYAPPRIFQILHELLRDGYADHAVLALGRCQARTFGIHVSWADEVEKADLSTQARLHALESQYDKHLRDLLEPLTNKISYTVEPRSEAFEAAMRLRGIEIRPFSSPDGRFPATAMTNVGAIFARVFVNKSGEFFGDQELIFLAKAFDVPIFFQKLACRRSSLVPIDLAIAIRGIVIPDF